MKTVQLGPLTAVITPDLPKQSVVTTVVLLHGYGAPGTDLVGLAAALPPIEGMRFVFPAALKPLIGPGVPPGGRAWWDIDMVRLQVGLMTGQTDALAEHTPEGLDAARDALHRALGDLEEHHGMRREALILGGFSQGAMLACDYALSNPSPLAGLIQLSGTMICRQRWLKLLPKRTGLPVFQSHSPDDMVLPMNLAEELARVMRAAGLAHRFVAFRGGHGIGPEVMVGLSRFLEECTVDVRGQGAT